ncbi:hypothetical protein CEXT_35021 [Caerostris extrusa]|uniref:Uncharacterized protein n=1 Tax=Caerostris extrusa TaxID=172846 RepID=A0AAV4VEJ8_CAEEX|nr:hypothetical protein CEXT_35021 [Caerostris extrusa]
MQQPIIDKEYKKGLFVGSFRSRSISPFGQDDMKGRDVQYQRAKRDFQNGACLLKKAVCFLVRLACTVQKAVGTQWARTPFTFIKSVGVLVFLFWGIIYLIS